MQAAPSGDGLDSMQMDDDDDAGFGAPEDDAMDEDLAAAAPQNGRQKVSEDFRKQVLAVLEERQLTGLRSAKLSQDDFLMLLSLFNKAGFHFS